ncbi:DUF3953 domain-containing protein [Paucisalibacillus sp. EB02]|uniref:DUF3953 domain-containing protein n=1 Tax=Paucisalibacillus sp. EB02 TaxID=1347087 RepID=UPI0005A8E2D4|nr:DUF3953 domain-containing protein [Paucisalibacillus sp. EB02]
MKIIKIILAIAVITLSVFSLINDSINLTSISSFLLGVLLLTIGAEEIKKEDKTVGYLLIIVAFFNLFVSLKALFLS